MPIDEKQAQEKGIAIIKTADLKDLQKKRFQALKQLFPEAVNSDNILDAQKLKELIGENNLSYEKQGYELTFAGKSLAKAQADSRGTKVLELNEKQSKNPDKTSNVVIRGDNLEVLKILKQNYENKIKMIYIDPPYNTKSDNFIYNDNFKVNEQELIEDFNLAEDDINYLNNLYGTKTHSGWLAFMYPRLKLARTLLKEDGVIFISIDDNEQANLKLLCDEIFGEENFVGCVPRKTRGSATTKSKAELQKLHDYLLVYWKCKKDKSFNLKHIGKKTYPYQDKRGKFYIVPLQDNGPHGTRTARPNLYYPIYFSKKGDLSLKKESKEDIVLLPKKHKNDDGRWMWSQKKFEIDNKDLYVKEGKIYIKHYYNINEDQNKYQVEKTWLDDYLNTSGTVSLNGTFDAKGIFNNPKPIKLLKWVIDISILSNTNDIILDFFAGSGTTGHAVMELNKERILEGKESNLKYILVQIDEKIKQGKSKNTNNTLEDTQEEDDLESSNDQETKNSNQASYNFCIENNLEPVISSITIERLNRAGEVIEQELEQLKTKQTQESLDLAGSNENLEIINKKIDIGYKVFTLVDEPTIKDVGGNLNFTNHGYTKTQDIIYNMLIKTNQPLDAKVTEIIKDKLYKIERNCYLIASILQEEKEKLLAEDYEYLYINAYDPTMDLENFLNTLHFDNSKKEYMKIIY